MEKAKLKFYSISRCGYYKRGNYQSSLTDLSSTLNEIKDWIVGKTLQQTKTTDFLDLKNEQLPVYCVGLEKSQSNHFLMATWNEIENISGNISSISKNEPISTATSNVESTILPEDNIPGFATFFWFIPEDDIVATIRFNHIENGMIKMNSFIKGFLARFSKYAIIEADENERENIKILGYGSEKDYETNLYPYFDTRLKRLNGKVEYIKNNIDKITKIIRKASVSSEVPQDESFFRSLMTKIGSKQNRKLDREIEFRLEVKTKPNYKELNDIIDSWREEHESVWDDVGFKMKKEDKPYWLSSEIPTKDIELNVNRINNEFVKLDDLLNELDQKLDIFRDIYNEDK